MSSTREQQAEAQRDDPLGPLHQAALGVEAERLGLGPHVADDRAERHDRERQHRHVGVLVEAKYQATPPNSRASVTRSMMESKNAPRWLEVLRGLGQRTVEQVGQRGEDDQQETEAELTEPDRDRGPDRHEQADDREVVGGQAGASQAVAEGLDGLVDRGAELSVEHRPKATPCPSSPWRNRWAAKPRPDLHER